MTTDTEEALRRQLAAFALFTSRSLSETDLESLMTEACLRARAGLAMTHAKLLEYLPGSDRMLLRAGVGWKPGFVGQYRTAPTLDTPVGLAFAFSEPVSVADYADQQKFEYPSILQEHGCVSSLNVPVRTDMGLFGVLEVDHTSAREFSADEVNFLSGLGNTIARAIELRRAFDALQHALEEKQLLIREMNHRIKNNLSLVSAILSLHARRSTQAGVQDELASAVARIRNFALVHDRLQLFSASVARVDAAQHFNELCDLLRSLLPDGIALVTRCSGAIVGDVIEALTLLANELVTNAAKYAFAGREAGEIVLGFREEGAGWRLWVEDDGVGLASAPPAKAGFGRQLIEILVERTNAQFACIERSGGGTRVEVSTGIDRT